MGNEINNSVNKPSVVKELGTSLAFSGALTGGFGSFGAITAHRTKVFKKTKLNNETINSFLKRNNFSDGFTKSYAAAKNYETLTSSAKKAAKAQRAIKKIDKNGVTWYQKLFHFGKSENAIKDAYQNKVDTWTDLSKKLEKGDTTGIVVAGTLKDNMKGLFKEELLNPLNIAITGFSALARIKNEAAPVFKEKGFVAGIKATAKVVAKSVADVFSNAGFSAGFRLVGSRVGMIFGPAGAAVGGLVGDIVGSFVSNKLIVKLFGEDKIEQTQQASENNQAIAAQQQAQYQQKQQVQKSSAAQVAFSGKATNSFATTRRNSSAPIYGPRAQKKEVQFKANYIA